MVETPTVVLPQEYLVPGMMSKIKLDLNTISVHGILVMVASANRGRDDSSLCSALAKVDKKSSSVFVAHSVRRPTDCPLARPPLSFPLPPPSILAFSSHLRTHRGAGHTQATQGKGGGREGRQDLKVGLLQDLNHLHSVRITY